MQFLPDSLKTNLFHLAKHLILKITKWSIKIKCPKNEKV